MVVVEEEAMPTEHTRRADDVTYVYDDVTYVWWWRRRRKQCQQSIPGGQEQLKRT